MIFTLAIAGTAVITVFAVLMLALYVSMAIADNGYVGKHRPLADQRTRKSTKRNRAAGGPRSYHRTLGGRGTGTAGRRPVSRTRQAHISA